MWVNSNELFSYLFSLTNIIGSQHPYGFTMNSLKGSIKPEAAAVVQILLECTSESGFFFFFKCALMSHRFLATLIISLSTGSLIFQWIYRYYRSNKD